MKARKDWPGTNRTRPLMSTRPTDHRLSGRLAVNAYKFIFLAFVGAVRQLDVQPVLNAPIPSARLLDRPGYKLSDDKIGQVGGKIERFIPRLLDQGHSRHQFGPGSGARLLLGLLIRIRIRVGIRSAYGQLG